MTDKLWWPHTSKEYRHYVISDYVNNSDHLGVVCFSVAGMQALATSLNVYDIPYIDISPHGALQTNRWWSLEEINITWPNLFDATSGHLQPPLMDRTAELMKQSLGKFDKATYYVPTGSGESLICTAMAYPHLNFVAVYNLNDVTQHNPQSPLNKMVAAVCEDVIVEPTLEMLQTMPQVEKDRLSGQPKLH